MGMIQDTKLGAGSREETDKKSRALRSSDEARATNKPDLINEIQILQIDHFKTPLYGNGLYRFPIDQLALICRSTRQEDPFDPGCRPKGRHHALQHGSHDTCEARRR